MPRFSIVIPTRNRAYTLQHTLRTCIEQREFEDYEIVVSDNFSTDDTAEMVMKFASDKIKYYKTDAPLTMTDSFNFAVSKAKGDYVVFIGSDDAVHTYGLYLLDKVLSTTGEKVVRWVPGHYFWPDYMYSHERCHFHIRESTTFSITRAKENVKRIVNYTQGYEHLPICYLYTAVHKSILQEIENRAGSVFDSIPPDYYSGFAISAVVDHFITIGIPVCIMGISGMSIGSTGILGKPEKHQVGMFMHAGVSTYCDSIVMDNFFCAKRNLGAFDGIEVDYRKHIQSVVNECYSINMYRGEQGRSVFARNIETIKHVINNSLELMSYCDTKELNTDNYIFLEPEQVLHTSQLGSMTCIDTSMFGAENILDVALLTERLFHNKKNIDIFLSKLQQSWDRILELSASLSGYKRLGVYATGSHTAKFLDMYESFCDADCELVLFDSSSDKWGTLFHGHKVLPPSAIPEQCLDALVISSFVYQNEIYESIKQYSCSTKIIKLYGKNSVNLPAQTFFSY